MIGMNETDTISGSKIEFPRDDAYRIICEHLKYCDGYTNDNRNSATESLESQIIWSYINLVEKFYPKLNDYFYTPNGMNCKILNSTKYYLWISHITDTIREELEITVNEFSYVHELFDGNIPDQIVRIILNLIWDAKVSTDISADTTKEHTKPSKTKSMKLGSEVMFMTKYGSYDYAMLSLYIDRLMLKTDQLEKIVHFAEDGSVVIYNRDEKIVSKIISEISNKVETHCSEERKRQLLDAALTIVVKRITQPNAIGHGFIFKD